MTCENYGASFYFLPSNTLTHCVAALVRIVDSVQRKELGRQVIFSDRIDPSAQYSTWENRLFNLYLYLGVMDKSLTSFASGLRFNPSDFFSKIRL